MAKNLHYYLLKREWGLLLPTFFFLFIIETETKLYEIKIK